MSNAYAPRRTRRLFAALLAAALVTAGALAGAAPAFAETAPPVAVPGAPDLASAYTGYNGLIYLSGIQEGGPDLVAWIYDGTEFTELPNSPVGVNDLYAYGSHLLIVAIDDIANPPYDYVLYDFDGSTVSPFATTFSSPQDFLQLNGVLYFLAQSGGVSEVWQYDGTTFSTISGAYENPYSPSAFGGKLYFAADSDPTPGENDVLYSYDPAAPAAALPVPGSPTDPTEITSFEGRGYLGGAGQLYSFDGTVFTNIPALAPATNPFGFVGFEDDLYFLAFDGDVYRLYVYTSGTVTEVPGGISESGDFAEFDGGLYFPGFEIGSNGSLKVLRDGVAAPISGSPESAYDPVVINGNLYFTGDIPGGASNQMFVVTLASDVDPEAAGLPATGSDLGAVALAALTLMIVGGVAMTRTVRRRA